mgnify:CR=1 FL=1
MSKVKTEENPVEEKLKALFDLQTIDSKIDKIRTVRGELPLEVQDLEEIVQVLCSTPHFGILGKRKNRFILQVYGSKNVELEVKKMENRLNRR